MSRTFRAEPPRWHVVDLGGVPWHEAPAPRARHAHWAQTSGTGPAGETVERCACGAIRTLGGNPLLSSWGMIYPDEPRVAPRRGILSRIFRKA